MGHCLQLQELNHRHGEELQKARQTCEEQLAEERLWQAAQTAPGLGLRPERRASRLTATVQVCVFQDVAAPFEHA